jgi:hypothetical protein
MSRDRLDDQNETEDLLVDETDALEGSDQPGGGTGTGSGGGRGAVSDMADDDSSER